MTMGSQTDRAEGQNSSFALLGEREGNSGVETKRREREHPGH